MEGVGAVVRARITGSTFSSEAGDASYQFVRGELGVLTWNRIADHVNAWEPFIVWDGDPARKDRKVLLAAVEVVGIQAREERFVCSK